MFRTKYKLEEAKEIVLESVLKRKNSISYLHASNKKVEKNKKEKIENNLIENNEYSNKILNKSSCLDEKINMNSQTNRLTTNKFKTKDLNTNPNETPNQHGHRKQITYRKNLTINPVLHSNVDTSQKLASKTPVARGRSNSISKSIKEHSNSKSRITKGNSPEKFEIQKKILTPNQPFKQIDSNLSDIRKHLSNYYDSKNQSTTKNYNYDNYKNSTTSHDGKIENQQEIVHIINTNITTNFNQKNKSNNYKQKGIEVPEYFNTPELNMKKIEEENLQDILKKKSPYEFSFKRAEFNTFGTINNTIDSSRQSNQKNYSKTYNFKPAILQKNNNDNSTNLKDPSFSTKIEEIKNANYKRLKDLNIVNGYINCLSSEFNSPLYSNIISNPNSKPNEENVDELASDDKAYLDSQIEQEKVRFEINKKIKNQAYDNEYSRVNNDIDYLNERLKLNEMSKSYLLNKINEFTTVKSVEKEKKVILPKDYAHYKCRNVEEDENQKNIGI